MGKTVKFLIFIVLICNLPTCNLRIASAIGYQTIAGYTTRDWLFSGPIHKWCITDTAANGTHIAWTYSRFSPTTDPNARYNFFNFTNWIWNWEEGFSVFPQRASFSSMDNHPITGCIYIMGPSLARDVAPGIGIFEFFPILLNMISPVIAVTPDSVVHCLYIDAFSMDTLLYTKLLPGGNWSTPIRICAPAPEPTNPSHNFTASKISNKLIAVWICAEDQGQERAFYRLSYDGGLTWLAPAQLPFPPSQGIGPSFNSLYTMFDNQDNFHIIASVNDTTGYTAPAEIWHYCSVNSPQWSLIYHYDPDSIYAPIGYNAIFATRPTIVQNSRDNYLYVAWEQFDSLNYEPLTYLSRADIMIAESPNNGLTWQNQQPITIPNTTSKRFPCVGGVDHDTLSIAYMIDSIAGFEAYAQAWATRNPIVLHRIKVPLLSGIEENSMFHASSFTLQVSPNPFSSHTTFRFFSPTQTNISLDIYDITGRLVKSFTAVSGLRSAESEIIWDGRDNQNAKVKNGIYFCDLRTRDRTFREKIILSR